MVPPSHKTSQGIPPVTGLDQLRGAVGSVFFVWADLETALRAELAAMDCTATPHAAGQLVRVWLDAHAARLSASPAHLTFVNEIAAHMNAGRVLRNRLAHGIGNWSLANGGSIDTHLNGTVTRITLADIQVMVERMNTIASHLTRITSFTMHPERWRNSDMQSEIRAILIRDAAAAGPGTG